MKSASQIQKVQFGYILFTSISFHLLHHVFIIFFIFFIISSFTSLSSWMVFVMKIYKLNFFLLFQAFIWLD